MIRTTRPRRTLIGGATTLGVVGTATVALALGMTTAVAPLAPVGVPWQGHPLSKVGSPASETQDLLAAAADRAQARLAPRGSVPAGAYGTAFAQLSALPASGGSWQEVTGVPYDADAVNYRDPYFSNSGGGSGLVSGRVTGLALGLGLSASSPAIYAGGANGGVFRSTNGGATWTSLSDALPALSTGDLAYDAANDTLWLATGEANTGAESYVGTGVYRLVDPLNHVFSQANRVGGNELESRAINKIKFDGAGSVYAATTRGLWKHSTLPADLATSWANVLMPNLADDSNIAKPYRNIVNDVAIQPGTHGQRVIANAAWRSGDTYNGFYLSTDGGAHFTKTNPGGAINPKDIGNAEFSYSADGRKLYTVVESPALLVSGRQSGNSVLGGVYVSNNGSVTGPWSQIADYRKLGNSGSALKTDAAGKGYGPGVQAWYNNFIAVDPANANHVVLGLEEVFETANGGSTWKAIGPYWNFGFSCYGPTAATNRCPMTTHPDQHSVAIDAVNNRLYIGNDGGVYARDLHGPVNAEGHATDWASLNAGLDTLQYYSVGVGLDPNGHGYAVMGGLQDNGGSLLRAGETTMVSPFGGDGGDSIVDPENACNIVDEYVYLTLWLTKNCGVTDGIDHAIIDVSVPDVAARFTAPYAADAINGDHWYAGGQSVWKDTRGFATTSSNDWNALYDTGSGHLIVSIDSNKDVVYAGWCGQTNCNSSGFTRGVVTNYGTAGWHQLDVSALPNRYPSAVRVDPNDPTGATVYVAFNGFNRRFIEGPGIGVGHLWKGHLDAVGNATWTDVSGTGASALPDVPANEVLVVGTALVVGTDLGAFVSHDGGDTWMRLGAASGPGTLPLSTVLDLRAGPDGFVYAATYGRGIWKIPVGSV